MGMIYLLTHNCHSERSEDVLLNEVKNLGSIMAGVNVDGHEILPPFGRLNDKSTKKYIVT